MKRVFKAEVIKKSLFAGLLMLVFGMAIQIIKGKLIFKKDPPELWFIVAVSLIYIVMGFLLALGFSLFKDRIPGKTNMQKSLLHSLFISLIVLIPGILGMIAFDHGGKFDMATSYKIEVYVMLFIDVLNIFIIGLFLGRFFKNDIKPIVSSDISKSKMLTACAFGFVFFPIFMLGFHLLGEKIGLFDYRLAGSVKIWYYIGMLAPMTMSGAFLPVFFFYGKDEFSGGWLMQSIKFSLSFFVFYWAISIIFLLPFGYSLQLVLFYLLISILNLTAFGLIFGCFFNHDKRKAH